MSDTQTNYFRTNNKIKQLYRTRLGDAIKEFNSSVGLTNTELAVVYPRSFAVGAPSVTFDHATDQYPAMAIWDSTSTTSYDDITTHKTEVYTYNIAVADLVDAASVQSSAQRASYLCKIMQKVLEEHLPDSTNTSGHCIFRVDSVSSTSAQSQQINGQSNSFAIIAQATINVSIRSEMPYSPDYSPAMASRYIKEYVESKFYPSGSVDVYGSDGITQTLLGQAGLNESTNITWDSGDGYTLLGIDFTGTNWPQGNGTGDSSYIVIDQNQYKVIASDKLSSDSGFILLPFATTQINDGSKIQIIVTHDLFNTAMTYNFNVTIT